MRCARAWRDYNATYNQVNCGVISYLIYNPHMDKNKFIALAGSQDKLAKLLGISQAAISQWKTVPQARVWQLKLLKPEWFLV